MFILQHILHFFLVEISTLTTNQNVWRSMALSVGGLDQCRQLVLAGLLYYYVQRFGMVRSFNMSPEFYITRRKKRTNNVAVTILTLLNSATVSTPTLSPKPLFTLS